MEPDSGLIRAKFNFTTMNTDDNCNHTNFVTLIAPFLLFINHRLFFVYLT